MLYDYIEPNFVPKHQTVVSQILKFINICNIIQYEKQFS
ncbi:MAG: hypothetical protein ACI9UJ_002424, partial [bacterium]